MERDSGAGLVRIGLRSGRFRARGGVAVVAARSGIGRWRGMIGHGAAAAGRPGRGQAVGNVCKKVLASNRCLSIGRR